MIKNDLLSKSIVSDNSLTSREMSLEILGVDVKD